jgi:hypothetical protein
MINLLPNVGIIQFQIFSKNTIPKYTCIMDNIFPNICIMANLFVKLKLQICFVIDLLFKFKF